MSGGMIDGFWGMQAVDGATVNVSGGSVRRLFIYAGSTTNWSGGNIAQLDAEAGATLNLFGTNFLLNGLPIAGLNQPGDSHLLSNRGGALLTGLLADGSPINLELNTEFVSGMDQIHENSLLQLYVVPEPAVACLVLAGVIPAFGVRRRSVAWRFFAGA